MKRYIDAEKLIDDIRPFAEYDSNLSNKDWVRRFEIAIDAQPTADVRENVRGEWIEMDDGWDGIYYECSICKESFILFDGTPQDNGYNFCPNCGADMRGGKK